MLRFGHIHFRDHIWFDDKGFRGMIEGWFTISDQGYVSFNDNGKRPATAGQQWENLVPFSNITRIRFYEDVK